MALHETVDRARNEKQKNVLLRYQTRLSSDSLKKLLETSMKLRARSKALRLGEPFRSVESGD